MSSWCTRFLDGNHNGPIFSGAATGDGKQHSVKYCIQRDLRRRKLTLIRSLHAGVLKLQQLKHAARYCHCYLGLYITINSKRRSDKSISHYYPAGTCGIAPQVLMHLSRGCALLICRSGLGTNHSTHSRREAQAT